MSTYTVTLMPPKNITLHYTHHNIHTTGFDSEKYTLRNVEQTEMDELFRSGIVLSATKNLPDEKDNKK